MKKRSAPRNGRQEDSKVIRLCGLNPPGGIGRRVQDKRNELLVHSKHLTDNMRLFSFVDVVPPGKYAGLVFFSIITD